MTQNASLSKAAAPSPEPTSSRVSKPRQLGRWGLIVLTAFLLGLLAWEICATVIQHRAAAREQDWQRAAGLLAQERRDQGEPVLVAPAWVEPLARQHLGEQVDLELWLLSDVERYPRVWQASIRGARHPWLAGLTPAQSWRNGPVTISLFTKPAAELLYDFTAQVRQAQVERAGQTLQRCSWREDRFRCDPRQGWNWVGPHLAEVDHRPYRCIYAHPVEGSVMRLTFRDVPLGAQLVGYSGIDDFENRKRSQAPVRLAVSVGDAPATTVVHPGDSAWRRFAIAIPGEAGRRAAVRFEISAERAFARPFCFTAEVRR